VVLEFNISTYRDIHCPDVALESVQLSIVMQRSSKFFKEKILPKAPKC